MHPKNSFSVKMLSLCTALLLIPSTMFAVSVSDLLRTPDDSIVMRGDFIRASVKALGIGVDPTTSLPYKRIPASMEPYVRAAYAKGALKTFGSELYPSLSITKGQALEVLMGLEGLSADKPARQIYQDLNGATANLMEAVDVAISMGWMEPKSTTVFGVKDPLNGRDGRLLLRKVLGEGGAQEDENQEESIPTIRIKINSINPNGELPKKEVLETLWKVISDDYLYPEKIKGDDAAYKAAESMVQSLGDPYSTFYRPASSRDFQSRLNGEISGIGAQVEERSGVLTIVAPLQGSPAEKAGLLPGDEILSVNGESIVGMPYEDAVDKVRGPTGSSALLHIRRNGTEFDISVVRQTIKVPEMEVNWQGSIVIVKLYQFGKITDTDLRPTMQDIQAKHPKGIVLDLRNNPGGLLHAATTVVSNFLPSGSGVADIRARSGSRMESTTDSPTIDPSIPLVVLVNKGSASASEIVAGALQDAGRATILGEQTFGKGTVQEVLEFTDHSSLKLTIAEWFTPKGRKINGIGVKPDVTVAMSDRDDQLTRAIGILEYGRR